MAYIQDMETQTGETEMTKPFNFANDPALAGIGNPMQRTADRRAAAGLISTDGQTHRTVAQMALYDNGASLHSREYRDASGR